MTWLNSYGECIAFTIANLSFRYYFPCVYYSVFQRKCFVFIRWAHDRIRTCRISDNSAGIQRGGWQQWVTGVWHEYCRRRHWSASSSSCHCWDVCERGAGLLHGTWSYRGITVLNNWIPYILYRHCGFFSHLVWKNLLLQGGIFKSCKMANSLDPDMVTNLFELRSSTTLHREALNTWMEVLQM